ncbi:MAG TPA: PfkB family carbohydrate kinase [Candidatus Dormibacteraeota bacterium]|jgi:sugar/nucleoside kinase (ribokinase family)|nr:PfkB family carbohydrate kinase [Candidatus Dormibacteraeota bacterium]
MAWAITATGTVTIDDVTTPVGRSREQEGGSALYFSLAAAPFAPVHLVGVVGGDGEARLRRTAAAAGVDLAGLEVSPAPTFRWRATHDFERWVTACEHAEEGAYASWRPRLEGAAARAEVLFLGSMPPAAQLEALAGSSARLVGADSMTVYIGGAERDRVLEVVERADVLFLNRAELAGLSGLEADRWREAARALCGRGRLRVVVVKAGPLGAACVTADGVIERDAHPVGTVVDPTGAGDALAGGFLGACARAERDPLEHLAEALDAGLRRAAQAISRFGPEGLLAPPVDGDGARAR